MSNVISLLDKLKEKSKTNEGTKLWLIRVEQLQDMAEERAKKERAKHNENVKRKYKLCNR